MVDNGNVERAAELRDFLRSRRARLEPPDVGLPWPAGQRRTSGLRRAELAAVAGVSVDYYTRLEQGRARNVSAQVLDALCSVRPRRRRLSDRRGPRRAGRGEW